MKEKQEIIIETRHNLKNMALALLELDDKQVKAEIKKLYRKVDLSKPNIYSLNPTIDLVLNNKLNKIELAEGKFELKSRVKEDIGIDDIDLAIILGNLLDNSIAELKKQDFKDRYLKIGIEQKPFSLLITIKNSKAINTDKNHKKRSLFNGIGLSSVKKLVREYKGSIKIEDEKDCFEVKLVLIMPNKSLK